MFQGASPVEESSFYEDLWRANMKENLQLVAQNFNFKRNLEIQERVHAEELKIERKYITKKLTRYE